MSIQSDFFKATFDLKDADAAAEEVDRIADENECNVCCSRWFSEKVKTPNGNYMVLCSDCRRGMQDHIDKKDDVVDDPCTMQYPFDNIMTNKTE